MNLVIPIAANSEFFNLSKNIYPKPYYEVCGRPMIDHVVENLSLINGVNKFIFIVRKDECDKYHFDNTLRLLTPVEPIIIKVSGETKGALCSVLLSIGDINTNHELIISNSDQIIDGGINGEINSLKKDNADAGCISFQSTHPRWSYVRLDDQTGQVLEVAEKKPISKNAIAGVYYYKSGKDFIKKSMDSIVGTAGNSGSYYISPVFNQYILSNKSVKAVSIANNRYHSFYTPKKIEEYERLR